MTALSPYCCSVKRVFPSEVRFLTWEGTTPFTMQCGPSFEALCQGCNSECSNHYGRSYYIASECVCWFTAVVTPFIFMLCWAMHSHYPITSMRRLFTSVCTSQWHDAAAYRCKAACMLMVQAHAWWWAAMWVNSSMHWGFHVDCSSKVGNSGGGFNGICLRENVYNTLRTDA